MQAIYYCWLRSFRSRFKSCLYPRSSKKSAWNHEGRQRCFSFCRECAARAQDQQSPALCSITATRQFRGRETRVNRLLRSHHWSAGWRCSKAFHGQRAGSGLRESQLKFYNCSLHQIRQGWWKRAQPRKKDSWHFKIKSLGDRLQNECFFSLSLSHYVTVPVHYLAKIALLLFCIKWKALRNKRLVISSSANSQVINSQKFTRHHALKDVQNSKVSSKETLIYKYNWNLYTFIDDS